jgi:uncharacterized protein YsxB (DUF464 family)
MIQADLVLDEAGLLRSCRVTGHAGAGKPGADIVCAAVSVLTRTIVRTLSGKKGIEIRGSIPDKGNFSMEVEYSGEGQGTVGREYLAAAGAFLSEGLLSVSEEFPNNCKVTIERRNSYGT